MKQQRVFLMPMDSRFFDDIKFNCDVSDARFWGYFSICGLLIRYRDLYRSEKGLEPWAEIRREDITGWISAKEGRWPELEHAAFRRLVINGRAYDPFDLEGVNNALQTEGLLYGAGYGMYMKPTFFLAELRERRDVDGLSVYTAKKELVRDLFTSPAMVREKIIFVRLEPLRDILLFVFSKLDFRRAGAAEDAFARYGLARRQIIDETFIKRLESVAERYSEVLITHELAEAAEEMPEWKDMLAAAGDRNVEHFMRAVKDLVADTSPRGPIRRIIETRDRAGLGLTVALADGYRRHLFPELKIAYGRMSQEENWDALEDMRKAAYGKFLALRNDIIERYRPGGGEGFVPAVRALIRQFE